MAGLLFLLAIQPVDINDIHRFPNEEQVAEMRCINRCYRQRLEAQRSVLHDWQDEYWDVMNSIEEANALDQTWWCLQEAIAAHKRCTTGTWLATEDCPEELTRIIDPDEYRCCLMYLNDIRSAVGGEYYAAGQMPPILPHWRFRELKKD